MRKIDEEIKKLWQERFHYQKQLKLKMKQNKQYNEVISKYGKLDEEADNHLKSINT